MPCTRPVLVRERPARRLHGTAAVLHPGVPCCNAAALRRNRYTMLQCGATDAPRARTRTQRQTVQHTKQTNKHIGNLTHANANERTHARTRVRTHGSRREREHCAALREDSQRRRQRRGDAWQPAMRWRNRLRCAATGGASLQQVVRRCKRWCVVAARRAALQPLRMHRT